MEKLFTAILAGIIIIPVLIALSLISGTIVWLVWPTAVLAFPALVTAGYLVPQISWWTAVCLSFLCSSLIKSTQTNNNK